MKLICVDPARVNEVLPAIVDHLETALDMCGDWTSAEVKQGLNSGAYLLWLPVDGLKIYGAVVTELLETKRSGRFCHIIAAGGVEFARWRHLIETVEKYAVSEGCNFIRFSGRKGWKRMFPDYEEPFVTLEKAL